MRLHGAGSAASWPPAGDRDITEETLGIENVLPASYTKSILDSIRERSTRHNRVPPRPRAPEPTGQPWTKLERGARAEASRKRHAGRDRVLVGQLVLPFIEWKAAA